MMSNFVVLSFTEWFVAPQAISKAVQIVSQKLSLLEVNFQSLLQLRKAQWRSRAVAEWEVSWCINCDMRRFHVPF